MKNTLNESLLTGLLVLTALAGCTQKDPNEPVSGRWYTPAQLTLGKTIFTNNCATCHGANAESTPNWQNTLPDNTYPPPPLNGSAHAWHHPLNLLLRTIDNGGVAIGGTMPAFKDSLSKEEKLAAVAYFQSYWDERVYKIWKDNGGLTR